MVTEANQIVVKSYDTEDQTYQDVLDNEKIIINISSLAQEFLKPRLGEFTDIESRNDLVAILPKYTMANIGGNAHLPVFCRIINMKNKNYMANILISWQRLEKCVKKPLSKKIKDYFNKLFNKKNER